MKKHVQSWSKGISQDLSTNKYSNQNFYWAQNFRLVSKDGLATGAMTNVKGTVPKLNIGGSGSIISTCQIRDTLILFCYSADGGKIFKWEHNDSDYEESPTLIYTDPNLNFDINKPIRAVGRYENDKIQKIYFTDGESFFKHLNIIPEEGDSYPLTYDIDSLDMVSDITYSDISLELDSGGSLKAGKIQYAYQLYSKRGSESMFSPTSQLIHITEADSNKDTFNYYGSEVGTNVNKAVQVTIENPDELFTRLRLVALEYTVLYQIPSIRIIGEYDIENLDNITINDTGQSIGELTLEEFRFIQNNFYPKSLDVKDNYLFTANITENYFEITDEDFDARTFRADSSDVVTVKNGNNSITVPHIGGVFTTGLPDFKDESFNEFNDVSLDYNGNVEAIETRCKYKPGTSGATLGGKGVNISYEFTTEQVVLDDSNKSYDFGEGYPRLTVGVSSTYSNQADPLSKVGYQRDEIYRFGIILFDKKGRESFVKWIGDIRFPNNQEMPYIEYNNTDGKVYANILGIDFDVSIPSSLDDIISGYRIVRTERTSSDKTILAQGLIGNPISAKDGGSFPGGPYDNYLYPMATNTTVNDMLAGYTKDERTTEIISNVSGADQVVEDRTDVVLDDRWVEFNSPDVTINKTTLSTSGAYLDVFGYQNRVETSGISSKNGFEGDNSDEAERDILWADKTKDFNYESSVRRVKADINRFRIFTPKSRSSEEGPENDATNFILDEEGQIYNNQGFAAVSSGDEKPKWGLKGTHALLTVDEPLTFDSAWGGSDIRFFIANYKVNKGRSQYNGSTYESRTTNIYYPASEFVAKNTSTVTVYGGDTYISYFTYLRTIYDKERSSGYRVESYMFYPVESVINLELRLDRMQEYINWGIYRDENVTDYKLTETVSNGVLNYGTLYPTELGDLYRYNSAYSSIDKAKEYYPQPFDFEENLTYDTRITASDVKINGEYTDSWTKFKFNNVLDVDSKHNAITKILTFKNNLFYFQSTAVGIASVNQRSLIQDNQPGQLAVGTGGILTRFDYVTDKSGSEFYDAIITTDDYLYYADGRRKRINKLVPGKEVAVSIVKGIDSTLDKYEWNTAVAGFDKGYNETIFSIDGNTLAFSEAADGFTSSYTFNPKLMINIGDAFYSVGSGADETPWLFGNFEFDKVGYVGENDSDPTWDYIIINSGDSGDVLYKHNVGDNGTFYNDAAQDSYITLIINPEGNNICYFDNLDLRTESTINNIDDPDDIFYRLEASNNYQEITRELGFTMDNIDPDKGYRYNAGNIKRIGRIWRTPIMGIPTSGTSNSRMLDTYLKLTLRYENTGNIFRLHDATVYYRTAKH